MNKKKSPNQLPGWGKGEGWVLDPFQKVKPPHLPLQEAKNAVDDEDRDCTRDNWAEGQHQLVAQRDKETLVFDTEDFPLPEAVVKFYPNHSDCG
ncbi:hypothetical protein K2Q00_02040 [Patescibacteria group bacterium]|nr:hypothetical protein [Patescibacteria group bacterium]